MALNQDTDRTKAIVIEHLSHRWLRWLNQKAAQLKDENGGYFDLHALFRSQDAPIETRIQGLYRAQQAMSEQIEEEEEEEPRRREG